MKKTISQAKDYTVEIETFHGPRDEILEIKVKAVSKKIAEQMARKAIKETYGDYAESLIEVRDITMTSID